MRNIIKKKDLKKGILEVEGSEQFVTEQIEELKEYMKNE